MQVFEFNGYELYSTDGYSHSHMAYFKHKSDAERASGNSGYVRVSDKKMHVVVFENYQEYVDFTADAERKAALAKLTPKERKLLGLE